MNLKIKKALKKQEKAINVFTQVMKVLTTTNKEMDDYLIELHEESQRINLEKEQALEIINDNKVVITNMEALFGGQKNDGM